MGLLIALIVVAIIFGAFGLLVEGLKWLLIIAVALLIAGVVAGAMNRRT